jgi:cobalamin biosynthetic protein CobC
MTHAPIRHGGNLLAAARYGRPAEAGSTCRPASIPTAIRCRLPADAWQRLPQDDDGLAGIAAQAYGAARAAGGRLAGGHPHAAALLRPGRVGIAALGYSEYAPAFAQAGHTVVRWTRPTSSAPIWPMRSITSSSSIRTTRRPGCCPSTPAALAALASRGGTLIVDEALSIAPARHRWPEAARHRD